MGEGSTFLYLGSSQIINDTPQKKSPKKTKKKNPPPPPLNAISDTQFRFKQLK